MPDTIIFAAWLGGMVVPAWYVLHRGWRWLLWLLLGIVFVSWVHAAPWNENVPVVVQHTLLEFLGYGAV